MAKVPAALERLARRDEFDPFEGAVGEPAGIPFDVFEEAPPLAAGRDLGIAVVGAGFVVHLGHLPAYRKGKLRVVGIWDADPARSEEARVAFELPRRFRSLDELLADPEVAVVDVALPPHAVREVVERVVAAGKHVLVQKPLAMTMADAAAMVGLAERHGVTLGVNQNTRWGAAVRAVKRCLDRGWLGAPVVATVELRFRMRWQEYLRDTRYRELMLLHQGVHHLDLFRFLFGEPSKVLAVLGRYPGQPEPGETIAQYTLLYDGGLIASALDDGFTWTSDTGVSFRIEGTQGVAKGAFGWPRRVPDALQLCSLSLGRGWVTPEFRTAFYPDSFLGTMADFLDAVATGRPPLTSGRDNLKTLALAFAAYRSAAEGRQVSPERFPLHHAESEGQRRVGS